MISISINVLLLDKTRFKEVTLRNGQTAKYCDLVLIETPEGKHGDFMVKQSVSKEERAARVQMPILGNCKDWSKNRPQSQAAPPPTSKPSAPEPENEVPF